MNKRIFISFWGLFISTIIIAQQADKGDVQRQSTGQDLKQTTITTAVPFLTIAPDSRGGGMGEVGVATNTDVWSQHWNASKYALSEENLAVGVSYTPWLESLGIKDINLLYLAGYSKIDAQQAVGMSLRYFSMGDIPAYGEGGQSLGFNLTPIEYAIDVSYSRYLSDFFVMGMTGRFINSNLGAGLDDYKPGRSVAADISGTFFQHITISSQPADLQIGFSISNIGKKIAYSDAQKDFIPTNLRLGAGLKTEIDSYNEIGFFLDFNKLLVPTPPLKVPYENELGDIEYTIVGKDPNVSVPTGIFQSFSDAPSGFKEEMNEIIINAGVEYWYSKQFAIRTGYFHESASKGNRKFFTIGAGLRLNVFGLDFAYLIPTQGTNSPLANTFRFSLTFDFEGLANENKTSTSQ
ncbi:MAG: type IX secretion system outer membrane channel protein PorV [Bacteroidales bacterium]|nr:type IX secretion system outer membrane channel protein PorV [Bacteroidales bacterium]